MDIYHYFGSDIGVGIDGDLSAVDTILESQQRVLRRLLTNPGTYIWHVNYGAGLPQYIGVALNTETFQKIKGLINAQMRLEQSVSNSPSPVITLQTISEGLYCSIKYTVANTGETVLSFTVTK